MLRFHNQPVNRPEASQNAQQNEYDKEQAMRAKLTVEEETNSETGPNANNHRKTNLAHEPKIPGKIAVTGIFHGLTRPASHLVFATPPLASYRPAI
jgi:hypothetical protein